MAGVSHADLVAGLSLVHQLYAGRTWSAANLGGRVRSPQAGERLFDEVDNEDEEHGDGDGEHEEDYCSIARGFADLMFLEAGLLNDEECPASGETPGDYRQRSLDLPRFCRVIGLDPLVELFFNLGRRGFHATPGSQPCVRRSGAKAPSALVAAGVPPPHEHSCCCSVLPPPVSTASSQSTMFALEEEELPSLRTNTARLRQRLRQLHLRV